MTQVCTIQELYMLIPETKKLEGQNFKDNKHLISSVINSIEKSGLWQFVQHSPGQPSLFIIREKESSINITNIENEYRKNIKDLSDKVNKFIKLYSESTLQDKSNPVESSAPEAGFFENQGITPPVLPPASLPWHKK